MRKLLFALIAVSLASFCLPIPAIAANNPSAVVQLSSMSDITGKTYNPTQNPSMAIAGYYPNTPSDGGEGTFVYAPGGCVDDGGSCVHSLDGAAWKRSNLNGDGPQFGITTGSLYDISAHPTDALDSAPVLQKIWTALAPLGLYNIDTKQVQIIIRTNLTSPSGANLTCSIGTVGPFDNGSVIGRPGTIVEVHNVSLQISNQSTSLRGCLIIPEMFWNPSVVSVWGGPSFSYPAINRDDLENIRANMILAADTGIVLNGTGTNSNKGLDISTVGIYGFDTCISGTNPSFTKIGDIVGACNIGTYYLGGGGQSNQSNNNFAPFLARQIQSGGTGANIKNEVYGTLSTLIPSSTTNSFGQHECRVTLVAGDVAFNPTQFAHTSILNAQGDAVSYPLWMNGLSTATGGLGCQGTGSYPMVPISQTSTQAVFDLVGSSIGTGSDKIPATAQWTAGSNLLRIASGDLRNFQIGETIADNGSSGIPSGSTITAIFPFSYGPLPNAGYLETIQISNATAISQTTDTSVTLDGGAYTYPGTVCDGGGSTTCAYLNAAQSSFSGNSTAGNAIANFSYAKGHHLAVGYVADGNPGFRAINLFAFAYATTMIMKDANNCNVYDVKSDNNGELDDLSRTGLVILGTSNCILVGHGQGKASTSLLEDLFDVNDIKSHNSIITTWSLGASSLGTITTVSGLTGWDNYAIGQHVTISGCQTFSAGCTSPEEYMSGVITGTNSIQILARGVFDSAPINFTNGMTIVQAAIVPDSGSVGLTNLGLGGTTKFNNVLDVERGTIQATALRVNTGLDFAFFGGGINKGSFVGDTMIGVTPVYETQSVFQNLVGCGNVWSSPQPWECLSFAPFTPSVTTSTTLDFSFHDVLCDATSGNVTLSVPQGSAYPGWFYNVTKIDTTSNLCILSMFSGDNIGGAVSRPLAVKNDAISFRNNSSSPTNWVLQ